MTKQKTKSRTYVTPHFANESKLDAIRELLPLWRSSMATVQLIQTRKLRTGHRLGWLTAEELSAYNLPLSARQLKSVTNQVNTALRSWQGLTVINVREMIRDSKLPDDERHELNKINVRCAWWSDPRTTKMVEKSLQVTPFPNMGRVRTMLMDSIICSVEEAKDASFDTWLRVSTSRKSHPVLIPVSRAGYFETREGVEAGITQVRVNEDGSVRFSRVKQSPVAEHIQEGRVIGLDWGMSSALFATSDGRLIGAQLYAWLKQRDAEVTKLGAALNKQKIKPNDSRRFRNLNRRIREHVRNEVNRALNLLAEDDVAELVVESLDFRGGGLSRGLNRIISRAGRGAVKAKLAALQEERGISVTEVNPAHTSRECTGCGFTSKKNRSSQSKFRCLFCGKKLHADISGARTILNRRSVQCSGYRWCSKDEVLTRLDSRFQQRWGVSAAEIRERQSRGYSTATLACTAA